MRSTLLAALILALGCGAPQEKSVTVSGTLLKGGKPLTFTTQGLPPGDPGLRVQFFKQEGGKDGEMFQAEVKPDAGTFAVKGTKGPGLPVGPYKVVVEKGAQGNPDEFKNAFSAGRTPLSIDLSGDGSANLEIDLDKKTVTKK